MRVASLPVWTQGCVDTGNINISAEIFHLKFLKREEGFLISFFLSYKRPEGKTSTTPRKAFIPYDE
jgi:hypothetical protein